LTVENQLSIAALSVGLPRRLIERDAVSLKARAVSLRDSIHGE
jgi:hypothetical protein